MHRSNQVPAAVIVAQEKESLPNHKGEIQKKTEKEEITKFTSNKTFLLQVMLLQTKHYQNSEDETREGEGSL